ncbi:PHB depolymerase family esterase [Streptomyces sp. TS71-3]|uniref:alpha/beta hydrolase family esterase n=1 Tax=Streptomyces sp. TS71-3 TaxID=2733862 RepID=UPI001B1E3244|nr:PHB depolymerase family esterase [Streptomyces sp. TS71-3]GHJ35682.1 hydrolase [Streptomyces sp. TS71-3]
MKRNSTRLRTLSAMATAVLTALAGLAAAPAPAGAVPAAAADVPAPTAGCQTTAPQQPGTSVLHTLASGGRERTYQLHLPAGYRADRPWPVILAFHGRGNTGAGTEEFSKLSTLPAVVAYPDGVVGTGEGDRQAWQGAPYEAPGVDDVAFTGDLLTALEDQLCLDSRRVYATGKSNGAGFTGLLACRMADRITAIAPVSGAFYPGTGTSADCHPSRPVPVIDFHGTGDTTIPYAGDEDRGLPAIPDWVAGWAERDGCTEQLPDRVIEPDITESTWAGADGRTRVEHVAVAGGGHTWPGADSYSGGGKTTQTIEAHEVLWRFLKHYRLP